MRIKIDVCSYFNVYTHIFIKRARTEYMAMITITKNNHEAASDAKSAIVGPSSRDDSITVVVDARWGLLDTLLGVVEGETVGVVEGEMVGVVEGETVGVVEGETVGEYEPSISEIIILIDGASAI
tara:strand:- start:1109 stop:1483 length:375 start_codon:yes stop_codon:yes gene_type:complete